MLGIAEASLDSNLLDFIVRERNTREREGKRSKSLILNNPFVTQKLVVLKKMEIVHMQWQKVQSSKVVDIHGWKKGKVRRNGIKIGE